jgi:hypothetical protein
MRTGPPPRRSPVPTASRDAAITQLCLYPGGYSRGQAHRLPARPRFNRGAKAATVLLTIHATSSPPGLAAPASTNSRPAGRPGLFGRAFSAATWWLLERSLGFQYGSKPSQYVLIFGAFGSAVLGVVYGPAWTALQRRGRRLCDEMFRLRERKEQAEILSEVTDRQKLEQALGLDRGIVADLQGGVVILAPLLASAVTTFLRTDKHARRPAGQPR